MRERSKINTELPADWIPADTLTSSVYPEVGAYRPRDLKFRAFLFFLPGRFLPSLGST